MAKRETRVHPRACVAPEARLGSEAEIGPGAVVGPHVRLGDRVRIGAHAVVTGFTEIGDDTRIWPGVVVGEEPQDRHFKGTRSFVRIGPRCLIREYVTIHRGSQEESETAIGPDCFLMACSHVAHNCRLAEGVILANGVLLAGHVEIGTGAMLGGNTSVHQFVRIGRQAMVGGLIPVWRDVPPFFLLRESGRVRGLNLVGLRRSGASPEALRELKRIFEMLRACAGSFDRCLVRIRGIPVTEEGLALASFLSAPSKRGVLLPGPPL